MARAWVLGVEDAEPDTNDLIIRLPVLFIGADVPRRVDRDMIQIRIVPTDTLVGVRTKLVDEVIALATAKGYSLVRTAVLVPAFERGS